MVEGGMSELGCESEGMWCTVLLDDSGLRKLWCRQEAREVGESGAALRRSRE